MHALIYRIVDCMTGQDGTNDEKWMSARPVEELAAFVHSQRNAVVESLLWFPPPPSLLYFQLFFFK